jgi:gas vesicle protein
MAAERDRSEREMGAAGGGGSSLAGFAMGVVFGALLGAGFALLYAPDRGDRTRRELKRRIHRLREDAEEGLDRAGGRARRELVRRRRQLEEGLDRAADKARDVLE